MYSVHIGQSIMTCTCVLTVGFELGNGMLSCLGKRFDFGLQGCFSQVSFVLLAMGCFLPRYVCIGIHSADEGQPA